MFWLRFQDLLECVAVLFRYMAVLAVCCSPWLAEAAYVRWVVPAVEPWFVQEPEQEVQRG